MFKESLKNKAKSIFGGTTSFIKDVGGEFKNAMVGQLVTELTNRSPVLGAALADSIKARADKKHNERIKASFTKLYADNISNTKDSPFASKVQEDLGKDAGKEDIQKKIVGILTQLDKDIKIQSKSDLQNNELYKRYSKEFQEYKKVIDKQSAKPTAKTQTKNESTPAQDNTEIVQKLVSIDKNTQETNSKLLDLISKVEKTPSQEPASEVISKQEPVSEVIPKQEPISEVVSKQAEKTGYDSVLNSLKDVVKEVKETNEILKDNETERAKDEAELKENNQEVNAEKDKPALKEPNERDKKQVEVQPRRSLKKVITDKATDLVLNGAKAAGSLALKGATALGGLALRGGKAVVESVKTSGAFGAAKEGVTKAKDGLVSLGSKAREGIVNRTPAIKEGIKTATQKVMGTASKAASAGSTVAKSTGSLGSKALSTMGALGAKAAGAASSFALPAAGVLAAGAAGYGLGTLINDKFLTNEDGSNKIGSWLFDKFGPEQPPINDPKLVNQPKAAPTAIKKQVAPIKNQVTSTVKKNVEQKEQNTAEKEQKSIQPVVINNSNNSNSSGSSKGPSQFSNMITGISVRNSESTFERVQMQDFWARTA